MVGWFDPLVCRYVRKLPAEYVGFGVDTGEVVATRPRVCLTEPGQCRPISAPLPVPPRGVYRGERDETRALWVVGHAMVFSPRRTTVFLLQF